MSALVLGALSQAAGCIFVSDDTAGDDIGGDGTASIDVTWVLQDSFVDDGVIAGCAGAGTATVYAQLGSDTPYTDIFDCVDGGGTSMDLPLGTYTVWVEITNDAGTALFAQSETATVNLTTDGQLATAVYDIENVNGFFDVVWTFANGESCADAVGEDGISILATLGGTTEATDDLYDCEDGGATTPAVPIGSYVVEVYIIDANNLSLGGAPEIQTSIDYGNEFVELDPVITID
jgi:hypothetical protein